MKSLYETFLDLNLAHFGNQLPYTQLSWNSRLSSTAGRFCPGRTRPGFERPPQIEIATYLQDIPDGEMHVTDTMLHEMIHLHLWAAGKPYGHTAEFHRIMKKVGAKRFNPVPKHRPFKHWYECPGCRKQTPTRRAITGSACLACCKKHSGGYYDKRFRLVRLELAPGEEPVPAVVQAAPAPAQEKKKIEPKPEEPCLPPSEIVRRLEELKQFLLRKTSVKA